MQIEPMDDQRKVVSVLHDRSVQDFAEELHEDDEVLLSKYVFALEDRLLTMDEARSFLDFVRTQKLPK